MKNAKLEGEDTLPRFFGVGLHFAASLRKPTAPTQLGEGATHDTHVPVTNPADITVQKNPLNSRARSVGWLAQFGVGLREPARGDGKCHQAP